MISPRTGKLMNQKYRTMLQKVSNLENSEVTQIFRNNFKPNTFYPRFGLFGCEFCLGYCYNMGTKNKNSNGPNDSL